MALFDWQAQTALAMLLGISAEFVEGSRFFDNDVWDLAMELPMDLPPRLFDRDRIGSVLKADLNSDRPASGKLFEILISFSEFSKLRSDPAHCSTDNGGMMVEDSIIA